MCALGLTSGDRGRSDSAPDTCASCAAQYSRHTVNVYLLAPGKLRNRVGTESEEYYNS
jgi:hypothetical protein